MIGGALAVIVLLFYETVGEVTSTANRRFLQEYLENSAILIMLLFIFRYADRITGGNILLRYQGETPGTIGGYREKTLNAFTANRLKCIQ